VKFTLQCNAQVPAPGCKKVYTFNKSVEDKDALVQAFAAAQGVCKVCLAAGCEPKQVNSSKAVSVRVQHTDDDEVTVTCARCKHSFEMTFADAKGWRYCEECTNERISA
jgi:ribosomal protein S12